MSANPPILSRPDRLALIRTSIEVTRALFEMQPVTTPSSTIEAPRRAQRRAGRADR